MENLNNIDTTKPSKNEYMRESQVIKEYPIGRSTLWKLVGNGKISTFKPSNGVTCFSRSELEAYFANCKVARG